MATNDKHFELTDEVKTLPDGTILHRIRATRDSKWAKEGELGGWVEKMDNLRDSAVVRGSAVVCDSAWVRGSAHLARQAARPQHIATKRLACASTAAASPVLLTSFALRCAQHTEIASLRASTSLSPR